MALSKGGAIRSKGAGPRRALSVAAIVVLAHAWIASAYGLTDEDIYGALRIPRSVAGARATAMGGASLALTDDASAASINPARLTALGSPQLAFDLLARNHAQTSSASGFIPFDTSINPFAGTTNSGSFDAQTTTTFGDIAYAHPIKLKRPLVLAISRQEILDVDLDAGAVGLTVPLSAPVTPSGGDEVRRISRGHLEAELDLYHVAAGWKVSPRLSVGGAVVVGNLHLTAETTGLLADPLQFTTVGMVDPRFTGSTAEPLVRTRSDGSDISLGFTLGTQLRVHPTLVLATAYRKGPSFEIPATRRDLSTGRTHSFGNTMKLPDVAAFGVAWTPFVGHRSEGLRTLTFTGDVERVENEDLLDGMREGENILTRPDFVRKVSYTAENATETRFGVEYRHPRTTWTLALRGGAYTDHGGAPELSSASGDLGALQGQSQALEQSGFFDGGEDRIHGTLGAGALFYQYSFEVAADFTEGETAVIASLQYTFR